MSYGNYAAFWNSLRFVKGLLFVAPDPLPEPKPPIEQGDTFTHAEAEQLVLFDVEAFGEPS